LLKCKLDIKIFNLRGDEMQIKQLRLAAGLKQEDLSKILGVRQSTVSCWESNSASPRAEMIPKLADALNCTINELYGRSAD